MGFGPQHAAGAPSRPSAAELPGALPRAPPPLPASRRSRPPHRKPPFPPPGTGSARRPPARRPSRRRTGRGRSSSQAALGRVPSHLLPVPNPARPHGEAQVPPRPRRQRRAAPVTPTAEPISRWLAAPWPPGRQAAGGGGRGHSPSRRRRRRPAWCGHRHVSARPARPRARPRASGAPRPRAPRQGCSPPAPGPGGAAQRGEPAARTRSAAAEQRRDSFRIMAGRSEPAPPPAARRAPDGLEAAGKMAAAAAAAASGTAPPAAPVCVLVLGMAGSGKTTFVQVSGGGGGQAGLLCVAAGPRALSRVRRGLTPLRVPAAPHGTPARAALSSLRDQLGPRCARPALPRQHR